MRRVLACIGLLLLVLLTASSARAASVWPLTPQSLAADGPVESVTTTGQHTYLTGEFSAIGTFTGSAAALSTTTGAPAGGFPAANGQVSFVLAIPGGGWYIGGDFTEVGGLQRLGLARIDADDNVDPNFTAVANGLVDALALNGSTLYVGGAFGDVDGMPREGLAAVDANSGALLPFDAHETGTATELCFLPATAGSPAVLYAGMGQVLALDPTTGAPLPGFNSNIEDNIQALAVGDGHLYVGGAGGLVALDPLTGTLDPAFNPTPVTLSGQADFKGAVNALDVLPGRVLVGGSYNALGGASGPLVALDPNSGAADRTFRPQIDGSIYDMDQSGSTLWIGGKFDRVGGVVADNIAALDAGTGLRLSQRTPRLNGQVNGIRVSGAQVLAGGQFDILNALHTNGFAELTGGTLNRSFAPPAPASITLASSPTALVSAPNQFQGYDPTSRKHPFTGSVDVVDVLNPATGHRRSRLRVTNLSGVALSGSELFIDQRVGNNARFPVNTVTVRSVLTGHLLHRFTLPLRGYVSQLLVTHGHLFVAGSFKRRRANGQQANLAIIEISERTGHLDSVFDPQANGPVYALASHGGDLYFSGLFSRVWFQHRAGLAAGTFASGGVVDSRFRPGVQGDNDTTLTVTAPALFVGLDTAANRFLHWSSGATDPLVTGIGLTGDDIYAVAPSPQGTVLAGAFQTPLQGISDAPLYFVRTLK